LHYLHSISRMIFDIIGMKSWNNSLVSGAGTANPSRVPNFIPHSKWVCFDIYVQFFRVCATPSSIFYVFFVDHCLSFSFSHCIVYPSIHGFWLPFGIFKLIIQLILHKIYIWHVDQQLYTTYMHDNTTIFNNDLKHSITSNGRVI
jgi:uncharacterized membrane protein (DUF485 family)